MRPTRRLDEHLDIRIGQVCEQEMLEFRGRATEVLEEQGPHLIIVEGIVAQGYQVFVAYNVVFDACGFIFSYINTRTAGIRLCAISP